MLRTRMLEPLWWGLQATLTLLPRSQGLAPSVLWLWGLCSLFPSSFGMNNWIPAVKLRWESLVLTSFCCIDEWQIKVTSVFSQWLCVGFWADYTGDDVGESPLPKALLYNKVWLLSLLLWLAITQFDWLLLSVTFFCVSRQQHANAQFGEGAAPSRSGRRCLSHGGWRRGLFCRPGQQAPCPSAQAGGQCFCFSPAARQWTIYF